MKKRFKLSSKKSKKYYKKTAGLTHKFNTKSRPMRGGTRL